MASDRHEIQVGMALVSAVIVLIVGLLWFQDYRFARDHVDIRAHFRSAGGLAVSDPVHVRGIPMGKVAAIDLDRSGIIVTLNVDRNIVLTDEARFFLGSAGLMGERLVNIEPGTGKPIGLDAAMSQTFEGEYELALSELAGSFDTLNASLLEFLERVSGLLGDVEENGGIGQMISETTQAARMAAQILEENASDLRRASRAMASVGEQMESLLDKYGDQLGSGMESMSRVAARMDSLVAQLQTVADGAEEVMTALRDEKGAIGKLIFNEEMGTDIEVSIKTLRFLMEDILANPERYLTVEIF